MVDVIELGAAARDGRVVSVRLFRGPATRRLVLLAGAMAVPQGFYERYARDLAARGYAVVTVDYRGIGASRSGSVRHLKARAVDWVKDLDAAVEVARKHVPDAPLAVVAHSFGGQILPLIEAADEVEVAVAVGTQFAHPSRWSGADRVRMAVIFRAMIPGLVGALGYLPGWSGIGEDVPGGVATDWARWCRTHEFLLDHVAEAPERYAAFRAPLEAIAIDDDDYAPLGGVEAYAARISSASVHRLSAADLGLETLGHFGPFRPPAAALWDRIAERLEQQARRVA